MGTLAKHIQDQFQVMCPAGWSCTTEVRVLSKEFEQRLGYRPAADVVLASNDGLFRLWIEFEVGRADPVANHTKFATAHLFQPQLASDTFVSMMSPQIAVGRRKLGSATILLMRHIGMRAFQTVLLPHLSPDRIKYLNAASNHLFSDSEIRIAGEIERALEVAKPQLSSDAHQIHFVGEMHEVMGNVRNWNHETASEHGVARWGRRTVKYFVHDPRTNLFAPSKFCAYVDANLVTTANEANALLPMTLSLYTSLDESETRFDGALARKHLEGRLAMRCRSAEEAPEVATQFAYWHSRRQHLITVNRGTPIFLTPAEWLA